MTMKRIICLLLMAMLLTVNALADAQVRLMRVKQPEASSEVRLYVNADNPPDDQNFTIFLNKNPIREPMTFQPVSETEEGTAYVFCLDISGTISKKDMNAAREALVAFCERMRPTDVMRVYSIGIGAEPLSDYTSDSAQIRSALEGISRRAQKTYLWQGVSMAADDLIVNRDRLPELAQIVVFSDGIDDSDGSISAADALQKVQDCGAPLRVVLMSSTKKNADNSALKWLCEESGGKLFDAQKQFEEGVQAFYETLDDDYCVHVELPYDKLTGDAEWYVQQIMDDKVYSSNILRNTLSQQGLPTPTPSPSPTPSPTPTPEPTVAVIGNPQVSIGGSTGESGGIPFIEDAVDIQWGADGAVDHYIAYVENQAGDRLNRITTTDTTWSLSTNMFVPELYTVHVGAVPVNGTLEDARWGQASFGIPTPTPEPTPTPTPTPTPSPTPTPTPSPTPTPTPVPISGVCWSLDGATLAPDALVAVGSKGIELTLVAEGDVADTAIRITNAEGEDVTATILPEGQPNPQALRIEKARLARGEIYTVTGTIRAANPEDDAQEAAVRVRARSWPIWPFICLGALVLLGLVLLLMRGRRKKPLPVPPPPPTAVPEQDPPTIVARRSDERDSIVRRVVFTETVGSGDTPHELTQVIRDSAMIGRDPDCAIFYKGATREERTISRRQAKLLLDSRGHLYIEPAGETVNPTCVDGRPIRRRVDLHAGSAISMGEITLVVKRIEEIQRN